MKTEGTDMSYGNKVKGSGWKLSLKIRGHLQADNIKHIGVKKRVRNYTLPKVTFCEIDLLYKYII